MNRLTPIVVATASMAALAATTIPAHAEAVVYENRTVRANPPEVSGHEYASLDIPTGYDRDRLNWHTVGFFEQVDQGRAIIVDLAPEADTVKKLEAERAEFAESAGDTYREFMFQVNDRDARVRARWIFSYSEPGTGDVDPLVSVMLMSGNQVKVVGTLPERVHVREIRRHVVHSVSFPS